MKIRVFVYVGHVSDLVFDLMARKARERLGYK